MDIMDSLFFDSIEIIFTSTESTPLVKNFVNLQLINMIYNELDFLLSSKS